MLGRLERHHTGYVSIIHRECTKNVPYSYEGGEGRQKYFLGRGLTFIRQSSDLKIKYFINFIYAVVLFSK